MRNIDRDVQHSRLRTWFAQEREGALLPPSDEPNPGSPPETAATLSGTLIETTLPDSRITVLAPSRMVLVGQGLRLRIDHRGVHRQPLSEVRLVLPMPEDAISDVDLQRTLARWAGKSATLHAHELVRSDEGFARTLHLVDAVGEQATLGHHSGRMLA